MSKRDNIDRLYKYSDFTPHDFYSFNIDELNASRIHTAILGETPETKMENAEERTHVAMVENKKNLLFFRIY